MKATQACWTSDVGWGKAPLGGLDPEAQLVLAFGSTGIFKDRTALDEVRDALPHAAVVGCTTAGEIRDTEVTDETLSVTAVRFDRSRIECRHATVTDADDGSAAGDALGRSLPKDGLAHVFVLSDGLKVNGSRLAAGLSRHVPAGVAVTGGLSGDGGRFEETLVLAEGVPQSGAVTAVGFYGDGLRVGYGSLGGWDPFGPERVITRSEGNVLYQLDENSALALYKRYLGDYAKDLPASGLLFPLTIWDDGDDYRVVRTVLSVDEEQQSMTFAGDLPQGWRARLMKANFDRLIDGAMGAAKTCLEDADGAELAILISCVGRKMILKQRVEEEVEAVRETLGPGPALTGFYSYGELAPFIRDTPCELHNQTMTITSFRES